MPLKPLFAALVFMALGSCHGQPASMHHPSNASIPAPIAAATNPYPAVGAIPLPAGYHRLPADHNPFAAWLRRVLLKKDRTVYLFNGRPKQNQEAQFAVLDISVGHADLQQCADAVMRLRAEFLYATHDHLNIDFYTGQGARLNFQEWANGGRVRLNGSRLVNYTLQDPDHYCESRACFDEFLNTVFTWCGTQSLEKQLVPKTLDNIMPGDVLIKGGAPGHAMIVMDVAEDAKGQRIYLLAQSYMPAQDIHIVNNPTDPALSPWYRADPAQSLVETPEWTFTTNPLRTWPRPIQKL